MVRANGANTNAEIRAPLSPHPPAQNRRSMHPSRPREAEWVARWLWASGGHAGRAGRAARAALRARIPRRELQRTATLASADRSSADTANRDGQRRRVNDLPRQGPRAKTSGEDK